MRTALLVALLTLACAAGPTAVAEATRIAVGVGDGVSIEDVVRQIEARTGRTVDRSLDEIGAVVVPVESSREAVPVLEELPGVEYVEPIGETRRLAFVPNDPLYKAQWYAGAIRAFDLWPSDPGASLAPVRVAVVDSGIDADHPEFRGRILAGESFVGSTWRRDTIGHGTFVAGELAAAVDNGEGLAGIGIPVQLLVAKVTDGEGLITVEAEAQAIKWAVDQGARVVNLSLAGVRDPRDPTNDEYSPVEQDAIEYAYSHGAVVVAASGNCDAAPACPWRYAGYPAALPHVIGVGALGADGKVPPFSNRDPVYVDIAAPGLGIISTFPRDLSDPDCAQVGYSICADGSATDYRDGAGTSFAAPLVSAGVATLISVNPRLTASQVTRLVEIAASRAGLAPRRRNPAKGAGTLDVVELLGAAAGSLPPPDAYEANDDAGERARRVPLRRSRLLRATIDYYDDPVDVYRVYLRKGRKVRIALEGELGGRSWVVLWRPGTEHVAPVTKVAVRSGSIVDWRRGEHPQVRATVSRSGWYFVQVKSPPKGGGAYSLLIEQPAAKSPA